MKMVSQIVLPIPVFNFYISLNVNPNSRDTAFALSPPLLNVLLLSRLYFQSERQEKKMKMKQLLHFQKKNFKFTFVGTRITL